MTGADRERRVVELLSEALERDGGERQSFLDRECGTDAELRAELEALLAEESAAGDGFLEVPAVAGLAAGKVAAPTRSLIDGAGDGPETAIEEPPSASGEPQTIGPYRIEERLGTGGMGAVYRAYHQRLDRWVALKRIHPEAAAEPRARRRFLREARAAARLNHPAIVQVYDIVEAEGSDWIVMELVEGTQLASLVRSGPLELDRFLPLAVEIAAGLAAAHEAGIIHRDLKTENVVVTAGNRASSGRATPGRASSGRAKILDFGLAKPLQVQDDDGTVSVEGVVLGTPRAMSPEQARNLELDHRSDLFSLGTLYYEMLTGATPFLGSSWYETLRRVHRRRHTPVRKQNPAIPRGLSNLIDRLLEKDPARRPQSAAEVALALQRLARDAGVEEAVSGLALPSAAAGAEAETAAGPLPTPTSEEALPIAETTIGLQPSAPAPRSVTGALPVAAPTSLGRHDTEERRQLTILCCDLIGAAGGSSALDPETLSEVAPAFQDLATRTIDRYAGHLANVLGHRVVSTFGYPQAQEDDARRAVLTALELVAEVERLAARRRDSVALRVGIHTGLAIVLSGSASGHRASGGTGQLVLGQTLDLATGIGSLAPANSVLVSDATEPLVEKFFALEALEPVAFPGFDQPLAAHRVLAARTGDPKSTAALLGPLVARQQELEVLLSQWRLARQGNGQAVLVSGEAGIGKTRLVQGLEERLAPEATWLVAQGSPYAQGSPLHPVIELLRRFLELAADDPPERQLTRLGEALDRHGLPPPEAVPLLAPLLSLPLGERYPTLDMSPEKRRQMTLEAIVALVLGVADRRPTVWVVEDLHWVDPSTLELLDLLIEQAASVPLFLLLVFRSGFEVPWERRGELSRLSLSRLSDEEAEGVIDRVPGGEELPPRIRRLIVEKTDGVPLFVEELTKTVVESGIVSEKGSTGTFRLAVPATLRDSLTARLDRLGRAKGVVQMAAALGREFPHALLAAVSTLDRAALDRQLERLVGAGLLSRRGFASRASYFFKQALIREAAYGSLLGNTRRRHHRRIAEILVERFAERPEGRPEIVAHHFTEAALPGPAIGHWLAAAQSALGQSANLEAAQDLGRGLELLADLPAGAERDHQELTLRVSLGAALIALEGYVAPEVERTYRRAQELCERAGDVPELFWVLAGLKNFHTAGGELSEALALGRRLVHIAESQEDPELLAAARGLSVDTSFFMGDFAAAVDGFEQAVATGTPGAFSYCDLSGSDVEVNAHAMASLALWHLGFGDRAAEVADRAIDLARQRGHAYSLAVALVFAGLEARYFRRQPQAVDEHARELLALAGERGFPLWINHGNIFGAWASSVLDRRGEGVGSDLPADAADAAVERLETALATLAAILGERHLASHHYAGVLAEVLCRRGRSAEARNLLAERVVEVAAGEDRFWEAELHRLLGEAALATDEPEPAAAEEAFGQALAIARRQGSKALELRAATSLGRLWAGAGRSAEARELLAPIYDGFTEGFDTPDLAAARELLETLSD